MKNKKQFLGILLSVLICVFVFAVIVYATTTIGNSITIGDALTVTGTVAVSGAGTATEFSVLGTASISEDLWASGSFQFGGGEGTATASYSRLGSTATGHSLSNSDDLMIDGNIEVDGTAYFDGTASMSDANGLMIGGGAKIFGGTASPSGSTLPCTVGSLYIRAGQTNDTDQATSLYICTNTNSWNQMIVEIDEASDYYVCGNGILEGYPDHEQCDDGNLTNGDGCDDGCYLEGEF